MSVTITDTGVSAFASASAAWRSAQTSAVAIAWPSRGLDARPITRPPRGNAASNIEGVNYQR
jgi:hypothetical protein